MKIIDIEKWERKEHFLLFQSRTRPQFSITFDIDVSNILKYKKMRAGVRLTDVLYYIIMRSVNAIPEFKMRIINLRPVEYEIVNAAFTYIPRSNRLHCNCVAEYSEQFLVFSKNISTARELADARPTLFPDGGGSQALIYISCLPDVYFSSLTNPWGDPWSDTVPRIILGKINPCTNSIPCCVEALHSFIDGVHISMFIDEIKNSFDYLNKKFSS